MFNFFDLFIVFTMGFLVGNIRRLYLLKQLLNKAGKDIDEAGELIGFVKSLDGKEDFEEYRRRSDYIRGLMDAITMLNKAI